jgi:hypothetical protein
MSATCWILLAVNDDPSIIRPAMRGAVDIMHSGSEVSPRWEKCLAEGENLGMRRCSYYTIEIVVRDDFNQSRIAVRKRNMKGQYLMAAMLAAALGARRTGRGAADHNVIDGSQLPRIEQAAQFLIHLRRAALRHRNIILCESNGSAKSSK